MKISHLSIYCAAAYNDAIVSTYLTIRKMISDEMKITDADMYNGAVLYTVGFLIGGIVANILTKRFCSNRIMMISQLLLFGVTIGFLFLKFSLTMLCIRFLQGIFVSCTVVAMNILLKQNLSQHEFNRFLALNAVFGCVMEGVIPIVNSFLSENYGFRASIVFIVFMIAISMTIYFLRFKDEEEKTDSYIVAAKATFFSYTNIVSSYLVFLLLVLGITEGFVDVVLHLLEDMLLNISNSLPVNTILPIAISLISVFASLAVNFASLFEKEEEEKNSRFNWNSICAKDKSKLLKLIYFVIWIGFFQFLLTSLMDYRLMVASIIFTTASMYVINYISSKIIYSIYYSPGCVVSSISLFESGVSALMQFFSFILIRFKSNRIIFIYLLLFSLIILGAVQYFYFFTRKLSNASYKKQKGILPP